MGIVVSVGGVSFPSKAGFIRHCQAILHKEEDDSEIVGEDAAFVDAILKGRPDKIAEIGPRKVVRYLRKHHRHCNTPCFFAELDDVSILDFSFKKFIAAYPNAAAA